MVFGRGGDGCVLEGLDQRLIGPDQAAAGAEVSLSLERDIGARHRPTGRPPQAQVGQEREPTLDGRRHELGRRLQDARRLSGVERGLEGIGSVCVRIERF